MENQTNYTGIDISKSFFDVAFLQAGRYTYYKFSNDRDGFNALLKVLPSGSWIVMEASGPYYLQLACFLDDGGVAVSVINPLVIRRFSQMRMSRAKTDKKDARMIAEYGKTEQPVLWQRPEQHIITLQQTAALLARLQTEHTALNNQLGSFDSSGMLTKELRKEIGTELLHKERLIKKLTKQMEQIAQVHYSGMLAGKHTGYGQENSNDVNRTKRRVYQV